MICLDIETIPAVTLEIAANLAPEGEDPERYASLTPALAKIVCVGMVNGNGDQKVFHATEGESMIVSSVFGVIGDVARWPLVTFNGRRFDLPVLMAAAMRHNVPIPPSVLGLMQEYRYSKTPNHVDVWELLTNFGACKGGLRAWSIGLGLGDPKPDEHSSNICRLVADGKIDEVAAGCLKDCEHTAKLYQRWLYVTKGK